MTELKIPALGDAVTEAQLVEWIVDDGATVTEGQEIYSVESDKSIVTVEAPAAGKLEIVAKAGEVYEVGFLVGHIR